MQAPEQDNRLQTATSPSLKILYNFFGLEESATGEELREAYMRFSRIWYPKASERSWIPSGPLAEKLNEEIYKVGSEAHHVLTHEYYRQNAWFINNAERIIELNQETRDFRKNCEQKYDEVQKALPKQEESTDYFPLSFLPIELIVQVCSFLSPKDLLHVILLSSFYQKLSMELAWNSVVASADSVKLFKFCRNWGPDYIPSRLDVTFFPAMLNDPYKALARFIPKKRFEELEGSHLEVSNPVIDRTHFQSSAAYFGYLISTAPDYIYHVIVNHPESHVLDLKDENEKPFDEYIAGQMSAFQALTLYRFESYLHQKLAHMIASKSKLPSPSKTRANFETTSAYFEYLIYNLHDLYCALHVDPTLINLQDENDQTLLFYPIKAAQYLSRDRIKWILHILTSVIDINLQLVDKNGNTFLHVTTQGCGNKFFNRSDLPACTDSVPFDVFYAFAQFAAERNFDFQSLNGNSKSVLHIAAEVEEESANPTYTLLCHRRASDHPANIDVDQLSREGLSALSYAVRQFKFKNIDYLFENTKVGGQICHKTIAFLRNEIHKLCDQARIGLGQCLEQGTEDTGRDFLEEESFRHSLAEKLYKIVTLQNILLKMIARFQHCKTTDYPKSELLNKLMTLRIVLKYQQSSYLQYRGVPRHTIERNKEIIAAISNSSEGCIRMLWDLFTHSSPKNPLFTFLIEAFKEELDIKLYQVYSACEKLLKPMDNSTTNVDELKKLLCVTLLGLEKSHPKQVTQDLIDYFKAITKEINIKECSTLFEHLLSYRESSAQTTPMWQQQVNRHIDWQAVVHAIRLNAMKQLESAAKGMDYSDVIKYLNASRELPIFALPNSFFEKKGNTWATRAIDELKQLREALEKAGHKREMQHSI